MAAALFRQARRAATFALHKLAQASARDPMPMTPSSPGPTSRIYFSQRLRLHYVDWGNASAPPLLLVHGGRDHCRNWDWVAAELRARWHVIAPDLRGHGDSEWSQDGTYMMAGYVYDLAQLIHQQRWRPSPSSPIRWAATSRCATPASIRRTSRSSSPSRAGPAPGCMAERVGQGVSRAHARAGSTSSAACRAACRGATRPIEDAWKRMQEENKHLSPEQARHLTQHGVNQNEDGTYSWKFDNYVRSWPPYDMTNADVEALWSRIACPTMLVYGKESWASNPREGRPRAAFQERAGGDGGGRGPLGAPRPARRIPGADRHVPRLIAAGRPGPYYRR